MWIIISIYLLIHTRSIARLEQAIIPADMNYPSLSIIIPIRNEEANLEMALRSICNLSYPDYQVILVNDRSTDATPGIINHFALKYSFVQAIHIRQLPEGWLGKNHALYTGYLSSDDEWMLFTDADIIYEPKALKRAMAYALGNNLDNLAVFPDVRSRSAWFNSVMETFRMMLEIRLRPWKVKDPKSGAYIGIGAFSLIKRTAYEGAGTHQVIALRPDDDLKLGERIKAAGYQQDVLYGTNELSLEWYTSIRAFVQGLMKNTFSTFDYSLLKLVPAVVLTFLVFVLPVPVLLLAGTRLERLMGLIILLFQFALFMFRGGQSAKWWYVFTIPFAGLLIIYIMVASALKTIRQKGIYWRDSFYSLEELKKGK
jgi:glycosyltransferase involved in cell wall biosynthesis